MRRIFWYLGSVFLLAFPIQAQQVIRGQVRDAVSGEGLALVTVQIEGTYRGTIANEDGEFVLEVTEFPLFVRLTCIGYKSAQVAVEGLPLKALDVRLTPVPFVMEETIVTGEDPAVRIMREVIRRKQEWRPLIQSYRAEAYARRILENDTDIVIMGEIASEIFWEREKGFREVIKSRRATANMDEEGFDFGSTEDFVNLYDDDIEIIDNQVIGPTHPDALSHYEFELVAFLADS